MYYHSNAPRIPPNPSWRSGGFVVWASCLACVTAGLGIISWRNGLLLNFLLEQFSWKKLYVLIFWDWFSKIAKQTTANKINQNRPKMGSGGIPNRPNIDPKWEEIFQITQSGYQMAPKTPWINVPHPFLPVLGSPLGPPNRPKINFWRKRVLQGTPFYRFCSKCCGSWFVGDFWSIFHEISMQK